MAVAKLKMAPHSPYKVARVAELIRGRDVVSVEYMLHTLKTPIAKIILNLIHSAAANAEHNDSLRRDDLTVKSVLVTQGPKLKRFKPRSRGSAGAFNRPTAHIQVEVGLE